jgi:hypothetical protein
MAAAVIAALMMVTAVMRRLKSVSPLARRLAAAASNQPSRGQVWRTRPRARMRVPDASTSPMRPYSVAHCRTSLWAWVVGVAPTSGTSYTLGVGPWPVIGRRAIRPAAAIQSCKRWSGRLWANRNANITTATAAQGASSALAIRVAWVVQYQASTTRAASIARRLPVRSNATPWTASAAARSGVRRR